MASTHYLIAASISSGVGNGTFIGRYEESPYMAITKGYVNCSNLGQVLIVLMEVGD